MSDTATKLSEPYRKRIGKVTFQISSFGTNQSSDTAQQLILQMLEQKIIRDNKKATENH